MTMSYRRLLLAAAGLSAILPVAGVARAQEVAAVEEIVVTAQKREQQAMDVPMSLTAYSGDRLQALGVDDFAKLSKFTPGLVVQDQSPNNPGYVIRGVTSDSTDSFSEARVSVFQDGVSISKAQGSYVELFDIDRVEVAKGPQSTLYGRGALIGAINVIQKKASLSGFDASAKLEAGDYGYRLGQGMFNVALSDMFAVRIAGSVRQRDGYVENALGGEDFQSLDSIALRGSLAFAPTDTFRADLILNWQEDQPAGTAFKSGGFSPTNPTTGAVLAGRKPWEPAALAAPTGFAAGPLGLDRTVKGATLLASWDLSDSLTLNSISAYREYDSTEVFDPDGTSLPILTGANHGWGKQWSQELRLNYDAGGRVKGFVGVSYFKAQDDQVLPLQFDERISLAVLTGQLNAAAAGSGLPATTPAPMAYFGNTAFTGALIQGLVANQTGNGVLLSNAQAQAIAGNLVSNHTETASNSSDLTAVDLFGDVTFEVTDKLEISAGLRYTRDDKDTGFGSSVGQRSVLGGVVGASQVYRSGAALVATGDPVKVAQGNAMIAQANAILGGLASPLAHSPTLPLPLFGLTFQPTTGNGGLATQSLKDEGFTWRLVARYALTDDANLYASYARGRRPDVLAVSSPTAPFGTPRFGVVEAEKVDSFEVGGKFALLDGRLRLDGAVFYYNYDNFQTVEQQGTLFTITNAGEAKAYGFEGQAEWRVATGLNLYATYAFNHARFEGGAYEGNRFRLSPDHSLSLAALWTFDALGGRFDVRPTYSWRSKVFFDDNNDRPDLQTVASGNLVADRVQDEFQDAVGLVDLRISYRPNGSNWTLGAFATNLTDEEYIIDAGNTGDALGLPTFIAGAPRMAGVSVSWKY